MLRLPLFIIFACWALFWMGAALEFQGKSASSSTLTLFVAIAAAPVIIANTAIGYRARWWAALRSSLEAHADDVDALPQRLNWLWIALAAGLGLYAELVLIRFHSSCTQVFAFFKNFSLLSCFLGLGIGYAMGSKRPLFTPLVMPLMAAQMLFLYILRFTPLADLLHNPISEQIALGLDQSQDLYHLATVYGFLLLVFGFNTLCFIPLGQLASRLMSRTPRLVAYSWNLIGSLASILLFYLLSFIWSGPAVWVGLLVLGMLVFLRRRVLATAAAASVVLAFLSINFKIDQYDVYSPYQILTVKIPKGADPEIRVNHVYFQRIQNLAGVEEGGTASRRGNVDPAAAGHYGLPYRMKPRPQNVLIVGSGTGNDVAAALRHNAGSVRAVEIDPAIKKFGELFHPENPYQSRRVKATINDARAFIRYTNERYDLIVYGLLDSHTLLSSMSGVRLDSFIYTVEAFREARARLKENGVICLSFCLIRPELGKKLYLMLQDAFEGKSPIVYSTGYDGGVAFVIGDSLSPASLPPPQVPMELVTDFFADPQLHADKSTDDWPFFYMPLRRYPVSYLIMIAVVLAVSVVFVSRLMPVASAGERVGSSFSVPCFLLGAGFMLLETKAVTELALYYGSTWVVIGVVIAAILLMAFLANLLLIQMKNLPLLLAYGLLLLTLAVSALPLSSALSSLGPWGSRLAATTLVSVPLFFAGLVFSSELSRSASVGVALSSNLLGAMLGGCLEYNAMYFGYRSLAILALGVYAAAFLYSLAMTKAWISDGDPNHLSR